jgi:hypothetical protein
MAAGRCVTGLAWSGTVVTAGKETAVNIGDEGGIGGIGRPAASASLTLFPSSPG